MLKLLYRQPWNLWRTLELRYKTEAILLFLLIYAFMATRLNTLFISWIDQGASAAGITLLISNAFTFIVSVSAVMILQWFVPRQKTIHIFISKPLDNKHITKLLTYCAFKYLSIYLVFLLPFISVFWIRFGILLTLLSISVVAVAGYGLLLIFFYLQNRFKAGPLFFTFALFLSFLYHGLFAAFYWPGNDVFTFQLLVLLIFTGLIIYLYSIKKSVLRLENFLGNRQKAAGKPKMLNTNVSGISRFFPLKIQALFEKEIYSLWRNPYYTKHKILSYLFFLIVTIVMLTILTEHAEIWLVAINCVVIWLHYSNHFNEKYVTSDPEWFIRTLPLKFRHLFLARYFSEIAFVILLLITDGVLIQFAHTPLSVQIYSLGFILLFAHLVLFTMLNFQIMFYDSTRLAGYAYHFSLLFIIIMILNYRLVGPVIALALLIFFFYKNVKYFND